MAEVIGIRVGVDDDASGPLRDLTLAAGAAKEALDKLTEQNKDSAKAETDNAKATGAASKALTDNAKAGEQDAKATGQVVKATDKATKATWSRTQAVEAALRVEGNHLNSQGKVVNAQNKYVKLAKSAEEAAEQLAASQREAAQAAEEQAKATAKAEGTVGRALDAMAREADRLEREWRSAFGNMDRDTGLLGDAIRRVRPKVVEAAGNAGKEAGDAFAKAYEKAVSGLDSGMGALGVAGGAGGTLMAQVDQDTAARQAAANMGSTIAPEVLKENAREVFTEGYGAAFSDVTLAQSGMLGTHREIAPDSDVAQDLVKDSLNMQSAWNLDPETLSRSTSGLTTYGLVDDPQQATDLMAAALGRTPQGSQDELTDAVEEYSKFFSAVGMSGEEMMGFITSYAPGGQYAVDKAADAVKEFDVRQISMDAAMGKGYDALGMNQKDMQGRYMAGDQTAVMAETVDGLLAIEDAGKRAATAQQIFGTPLEDLGSAEIDEFLYRLDEVPGALGEVQGATDRLDETMNGSGRTWQELVNTTVTAFAQLGDAAAPYLIPVVNVLSELAWILGPAAAGLMGLWVAVKAYKTVKGVNDWLSGFGLGLGGLKGKAAAAAGPGGVKGLLGALEPLGLTLEGTKDKVSGVDDATTQVIERLDDSKRAADGATDGMDELNGSLDKSNTRMGKAAKAAGILAGAYAGLELAGAAVSALSPMETIGQAPLDNALLTGDLSAADQQFRDAQWANGNGSFWSQAADSTVGNVENVGSAVHHMASAPWYARMDQGVNEWFGNETAMSAAGQDIASLDSSLADLVNADNAQTAATLYGQIVGQVVAAGGTEAEARSSFTQYRDALLAKAGRHVDSGELDGLMRTGAVESRASGGPVYGRLPGYSPGVDDLLYRTAVPGVPFLALGGGETIMRPEVDRVAGGLMGELNAAASSGGTAGVARVLSRPVLARASGGLVGAPMGGGSVAVAENAAPVIVHNTYNVTVAGDIANPRQKAQAFRRELERQEADAARKRYGRDK